MRRRLDTGETGARGAALRGALLCALALVVAAGVRQERPIRRRSKTRSSVFEIAASTPGTVLHRLLVP